MLNLGQNIEKISFRAGLLTASLLILFFLFMKVIGLVHNLELRIFNLLFMLGGIIWAIDHYKKVASSSMTYVKGIGIGLLTSSVAVAVFALFILTYTLWLNPGFMEVIQANDVFGIHLNPFIISFVIFLEGTASGFLATYCIMQYKKVSRLDEQYDQVM